MLSVTSQQRVFAAAFLVLAGLCTIVLPQGWIFGLLLLAVGFLGHVIANAIASAVAEEERTHDCVVSSAALASERARDLARVTLLPSVGWMSIRVGYADIFLDTNAIRLLQTVEKNRFDWLCEFLGLNITLVPSGWRALKEGIEGHAAVAVGSRYLIEGMGLMRREEFCRIGPPLFVFQGHFIIVRRDYKIQLLGEDRRAEDLPDDIKGKLLLGGKIAAEFQSDLYAAVVAAGRNVGVDVEPTPLETTEGMAALLDGSVPMYCGGLLQTAAILQSHSASCEILFTPEQIKLSSWNYLFAKAEMDASEIEALRGSLLQLHRFALDRLFRVYLMMIGELQEDEPGIVKAYSEAIRALPGGGELVQDVGQLLNMAFERPCDLLLGSDEQARRLQKQCREGDEYIEDWRNRERLGVGRVEVRVSEEQSHRG